MFGSGIRISTVTFSKFSPDGGTGEWWKLKWLNLED